jgi:hypothetical protein
MSYRLMCRTRDREDGIVHLRDAKSLQLAVCAAGFATSTLDIEVKHDAVPTCVFCVAGVASGLQHWRLERYESLRRQLIEKGLGIEP